MCNITQATQLKFLCPCTTVASPFLTLLPPKSLLPLLCCYYTVVLRRSIFVFCHFAPIHPFRKDIPHVATTVAQRFEIAPTRRIKEKAVVPHISSDHMVLKPPLILAESFPSQTLSYSILARNPALRDATRKFLPRPTRRRYSCQG